MLSKAERTKLFIIEKTAPVFNTRGYAGTSINDLMVATGLTKGSIYGNFTNKDEVALAAFDYNFQRVVLYLRGMMEARDTTIGKLLVYPETYRNFKKLPMLSAGCPITNTATEADDTHPMLKEKVANSVQFWRGSVERQLKAGIANGEIKGDTNIPEFVSVLVSLIQGGLMLAKVTGNMAALSAAMNFLEKMIRNLEV